MTRLPHRRRPDESLPAATSESSSAPIVVSSNTHQSDDVFVAWPLCPECRRERTSVCPYCKTTGSEFLQADDAERDWHRETGGLPITSRPTSDDPEAAPPLRVICPTCDEPFLPEFFNECAWCGHEFDDGIPTPNRLRQSPLPAAPRWTHRDAMLGLILVGVLGAVFGYFALIVQR